MSEYWKSTPSYWCKFCSQYVRDTTLERKNHEASAKHQNNIQRSLRELHKTNERERREKQQAKDEVARLNGMFGAKTAQQKSSTPIDPNPKASHPSPASGDAAAQRRAHAEQLAALGVELPEELKKEVTGVGSYHVVAERAVESGAATVNRSLADILAETRKLESEDRDETKLEEEPESASKGAMKRKAEDDEDQYDEEDAPRRKAWGSSIKKYPGVSSTMDDAVDLDALLGGVKKKEPSTKPEKVEDADAIKAEPEDESSRLHNDVPDNDPDKDTIVKQEHDISAAPPVVFKKRKGKK